MPVSRSLPLALVALPLFAGRAAAAETITIPFEKYTLPNGLDVILHVDHTVPTVHVELWYKVGSGDEAKGKTGFAHLFEHLMFQGTKHIPEDAFFQYLSEAGASDRNGSTGADRTNYFETLPANQLELALWLESSRMGFLLERPSFRATLANQRDVVKNERRQRIENVPMGSLSKVLFEGLFPSDHPYAHETIGSMADLDAATLADVKSFYQRAYAPGNAVLLIAGAIDVPGTRNLIEKYFAPIPPGPAMTRLPVPPPTLRDERRIGMEAKISLARETMAWHSVPNLAPGDATLDVLAAILTAGKASRLHRRLVYDLKIAQSVTAGQNGMLRAGIFQITFTPLAGHTLAEIEAVVDDEIDRLRRVPVDEREIQRVKNQLRTDFFRGLENLAGRARQLLAYDFYAGDPGFIARHLAAYQAVQPVDVQRATEKFLRKNARLIITVEPNPDAPIMGRVKAPVATVATLPARPGTIVTSAFADAGQPPAIATAKPLTESPPRLTPDAPFRHERPASGLQAAFTVPAVKRFKLNNGLRVILAESHTWPLVKVELDIKTGAAANPAGKAGLADLVADLLDEGTKTRSALQIADEIASLGATLSAGSGFDASSLSVSAMTDNIDAALEVWADVLANPAFDETEFARVRDNLLGALSRRQDSAPQVSTLTFGRALFGDKHPYGWPASGTVESVKRITATDLRKFWQKFYRPNNAVLIVAGDITEADVRAKIEPLLRGWKASPVVAPAVPRARALPHTKIFLVNKDGAPQSSIRIGLPGIPRRTPDYHKALVMNQLLGGSFKRLQLNLREQKGWTYGVSSAFEARRQPGPWLCWGEFVATHTADAIAEVLTEIKRLADEDVSEAELAVVKNEIGKGFPARFATISQVAGQMANLAVHDLPDHDLDTFQAKIAAVTRADVRKMARKYLLPDRMVIVVVGDAKTNRDALAKLAPIEWRGLDGGPTPNEPAGPTGQK